MANNRQTPKWGTVVGIIGICLGALRLLGATHELMMPVMLDMQKEMFEVMQQSFKEAEKRSKENASSSEDSKTPAPAVGKIFEWFSDIMAVPPWFEKMSVINGIIGLVIAALYILASIFLLTVRRGAPTMFVAIAGLSILRNMILIVVGVFSGSLFVMVMTIQGVFGLLIDIVLVVVVFVSDRSAYFENEPGAT